MGGAVTVWIMGFCERGGEGDADILGIGVGVGCGGGRVEVRDLIVIVINVLIGGGGGWGNNIWVGGVTGIGTLVRVDKGFGV